jgi:hypothetical protein
MKVGSLVRTVRRDLGAPTWSAASTGSIGLVIGVLPISKTGVLLLDEIGDSQEFQNAYAPYTLWDVLLHGEKEPRRYLGRDLELIEDAQ